MSIWVEVAVGERMLPFVTNLGELMFVEEVAELARVSVETVRFWIKRGKLPSIRPGRRRMIRRSDFESFLCGNQLGRARRGGSK